MFKKIINFCFNRPKTVIFILLVIVILAVLQFPQIKIDTDPENMLPADEHVRVFDKQVKKEFELYDFIVLGVTNKDNLEGVFTVSALNNIYRLTKEIKKIEGVISREVIAPATKDNIRQGQVGEVVFQWLMKEPIETKEEALFIRDEALDNPLYRDTMVSADGKAIAIYIPIEKKDLSYEISTKIEKIIKKINGQENYFITGLPVAEDTFGKQMFKQMAMSAPLAGLIIFLLMLFFFKNIRLIISPMILAIVTVIIAMGLLIGFGFSVHIMSSMIPIFLIPIAVLDSIHILSEFFDKYRIIGDKKETIFAVIDELFAPMLFTSLTSAVGFFSLSFSPIPPVQIFGVFVAIGILVAWFLTLVFIPAYISLISNKSLENLKNMSKEDVYNHGFLDTALINIRKFSINKAKYIVAVSVLIIFISIYGISKIEVNDNPTKWFEKKHPIRVADRVLNSHFGGTYTAYLVLENETEKSELFKNPEMLKYLENLQDYLVKETLVGKSTSLADVVKKVYYELMGDKSYNKIPDSRQAVTQTLFSFQNSHKPDDLWHFTTPDYSKVNLWLQLQSGDNKNMEEVVKATDNYFKKYKPPFEISYDWAGLTYINLVWQNKMVVGMLKNFLASFIIVFFMMTFLFRSPLRGLISMVPLTVTILFIYSLLGFIGKRYDMPVAVLSALTLGLSIDFAIHFIQRAREIFEKEGSWQKIAAKLFAGPSRAITRNALVIAIGFLPLLFAPLVPYKTVGFFMFCIMLISSIATLIILPAVITLVPKVVFEEKRIKMFCICKYCIIIAIAVSGALIYLLRGYNLVNWGPTAIISILVVAVLAGLCAKIAKHKACIKDGKEALR
ncbi:MAG: MMPL family transporter [Candidatus Omnitrophica bacterium]|nr:MMPL family transporter [Candidatus Omnitrophota bacterium]